MERITPRHWTAIALTAGLLMIVATRALLANEVHDGTIKSVSSTKLVLMTPSTEMTFVINGSTKITLGDKPAKVTDLQPGDTALVTVAARATRTAAAADSLIAARIDAQRSSSPDAPDPISP